jgi:AcrR family transcriptional regulator
MNSPGLRERKKQRTRWAIQDAALRLIAEQGYDATTVDQIAAAADISPSTFFRYFPSKEDLIIQDQYDDLLLAGLRSLPRDLTPLAALRETMRLAFAQMDAGELDKVLERTKLIMAVPALRARSLENFMDMLNMMSGAIADRTGLDATDFRIRVIAGAVVGAMVAVLDIWVESNGGDNLPELIDRTLEELESGLALP